MAKESSQKFIGRNRPPRVHITYELETKGMPKVELPMVMGVMADLSGKPSEPLPPVSERKFLEIDVDNFDDRMKGMKPRAAFQVDNVLTEEGGKMNVELTFEHDALMAIAAKANKRKTGARGLRAILEEIMIDIMYELPEYSGYEVIITKDVVESGEKPVYVKQSKEKIA